MTGFPIGAWDLPSGNRVRVSLANGNGTGGRTVRCAWHRFPPSKSDQRYYREVIGPEVMARLCEYLEIPPRKALYVEVE